jgi:hypothetical protein
VFVGEHPLRSLRRMSILSMRCSLGPRARFRSHCERSRRLC